MGITLIALKTGQQFIGDVEVNEETGLVVCCDPLQIGWVQPDKKFTRVLMTLSIFPPMIEGLVADLSAHSIALRATDVLCLVDTSKLKPEAVKDYERRRSEVYGKIAVVSSMPMGLKGEA